MNPDSPDCLRYPIGTYNDYSCESKQKAIEILAAFPQKLKIHASKMTKAELNSCYRPGGWTARQVINHVADSHMNSFTRVKLALTEENPVIKPYGEAKWATLADSADIDITAAMLIIEGIHARWTFLLQSLNEADFQRTFFHPEHQKQITIEETLLFYAWHCEHHLAHLMIIRNSVGFI
ncbi:MAG TPA: putative metal-dependent hydrolase [Flavobacterium sp.]|jgi:hypothetical protein